MAYKDIETAMASTDLIGATKRLMPLGVVED